MARIARKAYGNAEIAVAYPYHLLEYLAGCGVVNDVDIAAQQIEIQPEKC